MKEFETKLKLKIEECKNQMIHAEGLERIALVNQCVAYEDALLELYRCTEKAEILGK